MKSKFFRIGPFLFAALFGYIAYFYYSLATGDDRMARICAGFNPGMTRADAEKHATKSGLMPLKQDDGVVFLGETKTMGRYTCRIDMRMGVVQSSVVNFAD